MSERQSEKCIEINDKSQGNISKHLRHDKEDAMDRCKWRKMIKEAR